MAPLTLGMPETVQNEARRSKWTLQNWNSEQSLAPGGLHTHNPDENQGSNWGTSLVDVEMASAV